MWTRFVDMNSGGGRKEKWAYIYIEAPEAEAKAIFFNRFGHNPDRVSCTCCGRDYSTDEEATLEQSTAYERNCEYDDKKKKYVERQKQSAMDIRAKCRTKDTDPWGLHITLAQYIKRDDVMVIRKKDIKAKERKADIPQQGYVWVD